MAKQLHPNPNKNKGLQERVVVLMTKDQRGWLQGQSDSTGAPIGDIVRRAVDAYRQRLGKAK